MSAVRGIKTKTLVRELNRRRETLAGERDKLAARVDQLDAEIEEIDQAFSEEGARASEENHGPRLIASSNGKATAATRTVAQRAGISEVAAVLEKAKRPLTADDVFNRLRVTFPGETDERLRSIVHRSLWGLVDRGEATRSGTRGAYKYTWEA